MPQASLSPVSSLLRVNGLIFPVRLGVGDEERSRDQEVRFDLALGFHESPRAISSDRIEDTICYAALSGSIAQVCALKQYYLIEHLGFEAYQAVQAALRGQNGADLWLKITKLKPPIPGLTEGVSFSYGDRKLGPI